MTIPLSASVAAVPSPSATVLKAVLTEQAQPGNKVLFQLNPEKIGVSHAARLQEIPTANAAAAVADRQADLIYSALLKAVGETTITLSNLTFYGESVSRDCAQLLSWTYAKAKTDPSNPALPLLIFSWGVLSAEVNLISADVSYERFTTDGKPVGAKVNLRFNSCSLPPTRTNPSSGGIPGRRSHTMVAGENLQHIATANYGRPGAWRALAAANGIEDPFAVRPGTVIYLPAVTELADGGME
jgi:nucleoid-associated protein YgaU